MPEPETPSAHPSAEAELVQIARALLRQARSAALATLSPDGGPFASLVALAQGTEGSPILVLSGRAQHTLNLVRDPRASLLVGEIPDSSNPLTGPRLTLIGTAEPIAKDAASRSAFLARHPDAAGYIDLADFAFFRFGVADARLVAGFGRVGRISPAELTFPIG